MRVEGGVPNAGECIARLFPQEKSRKFNPKLYFSLYFRVGYVPGSKNRIFSTPGGFLGPTSTTHPKKVKPDFSTFWESGPTLDPCSPAKIEKIQLQTVFFAIFSRGLCPGVEKSSFFDPRGVFWVLPPPHTQKSQIFRLFWESGPTLDPCSPAFWPCFRLLSGHFFFRK